MRINRGIKLVQDLSLLIGDPPNRCDLVSAETGILDFHVYFVVEVNPTPDTFHKVHNDEQEYGGTSGWCRDLSVGLQ